MGGACSTKQLNEKYKKEHLKFSAKSFKTRDNSKRIGVDAKTILKWILRL
jgi:hypothetical protein